MQKQSFFNLLGQNGPRDKGLFTFYGGRVNGPPENFLFMNLSVFRESTPGWFPHLAKCVSSISDNED